jgi:hypothetical protein
VEDKHAIKRQLNDYNEKKSNGKTRSFRTLKQVLQRGKDNINTQPELGKLEMLQKCSATAVVPVVGCTHPPMGGGDYLGSTKWQGAQQRQRMWALPSLLFPYL